MAKLAAYYLLLLYSTVIIKPVLPLISDAISHFLVESEHMATVHAHHGDHHLEEEMADAGEEHDDNSKKHTLKTKDQVQVHEPSQTSPVGNMPIFGDNYTLSSPIRLPIMYLANQSPPPKFS